MRRFSVLFGFLSATTFFAAQAQQGTADLHLRVSTQPALVDCAPVSQQPCMTAGITPVDKDGQPARVNIPVAAALPTAITLRNGDGTSVHPFYASAGLSSAGAQRQNVVLLMVDISGSMNQPAPGSTSRFAAVKEAVTAFADGMQPGLDHIAIVPFQSHDVVPVIKAAVYATQKPELLNQLNALPAPAPANNTALYQAVFSGVQSLQDEIDQLQRKGISRDELEPHLVVMTDGKNEVKPGDDPQLLDGALGLQQAIAQVQNSHFDVIGIGFGDKNVIDAAAMQKLSTRFLFASDAGQLLDALHTTRSATTHEIQITWLLPENNRLSLMGRDPAWTPELTLDGGQVLSGDVVRMVGPATGAPVYDRKAADAELNALMAANPPTDAGWSAILFHFILVVALAALLVALWFWVPRLVWADRNLGPLQGRPRKWSSERPAVTSASGVQIRSANMPSGFGGPGAASAPLQRSASQTTQVQPRTHIQSANQ
ncbi:vWA domain-containing protein [Silvibacterium dinghuense]|uniref:VWA domain-containing protein n=1 Tax=Silvibacterium dinghuense TaxID=1560006 RepID=A0A4Q1SIL0_9BACT|nr:vWA domain-containing protein [Silvibacterium dinghuense]RXS97444.1 VWA domain-containing protein [Silvibacterium dinghuense]GGG99066.1 hypothetical protein GCM10011586_13200 [Silvibacterium dinghuense]